jgi:hypothetical protein
MPTWWTVAAKPVEWLLGKGWPGFCVLLSLLGWALCAWACSTLYADNRQLSEASSRMLVECYQRPRYRQRPPEPATAPEGTEDR